MLRNHGDLACCVDAGWRLRVVPVGPPRSGAIVGSIRRSRLPSARTKPHSSTNNEVQQRAGCGHHKTQRIGRQLNRRLCRNALMALPKVALSPLHFEMAFWSNTPNDPRSVAEFRQQRRSCACPRQTIGAHCNFELPYPLEVVR